MAELVEFNLEQCIPFFNGLKNHIDGEKLKEFVRKRRHFEYKICSLKRELNSFQWYVKHELDVLEFVYKLKIPEVKFLIKSQKNLIERIIKQMTIHFQAQPKVFLFAIKTMKKMKRTTSQKYYWEQLLSQHGCKDVRFYAAAGTSTMLEILQVINCRNETQMKSTVEKLETKLKLAKQNNTISKIKKLEKRIEELTAENDKLKQTNHVDLMVWTRERYLDGFSEFPKDKLLFLDYLKFEVWCRNYCSDIADLGEDLVPIRDGQLVELVLKRSLEYFDDIAVLKEVVRIARDWGSFESETLDVIVDKIRDSPAPQGDEMRLEQSAEPMQQDRDEFEEFQQKYPDSRLWRTKAPAVFEKELHTYLQLLKGKMVSGEIPAETEMPKIRKAIEWTLNSFEWAPVALDLWWDYYDIENSCGDQMKALMILQNADNKLNWDFKCTLNLRKLKATMQNHV